MRDVTTLKISQQTRYVISKEEQFTEEFDCEHAMCERFHQKWIDRAGVCHKPRKPRIEYVLVDTITKQRIDRYDGVYFTKREAAADLTRFLNLLTDVEWQQITQAGA